MYHLFLKDVAKNSALAPPVPAPSTSLRVMTFNVHFFQRGFGGGEEGSGISDEEAEGGLRDARALGALDRDLDSGRAEISNKALKSAKRA